MLKVRNKRSRTDYELRDDFKGGNMKAMMGNRIVERRYFPKFLVLVGTTQFIDSCTLLILGINLDYCTYLSMHLNLN